ncbi:MAG: DnaA N-terminal domain-containing protein, partial [Victivallales bacterium]
MQVVKSNVADVWRVAADRLQQQIHSTTYEQWFQNIVPLTLNGQALMLGVSDDFFADWLKDNFDDILTDSL